MPCVQLYAFHLTRIHTVLLLLRNKLIDLCVVLVVGDQKTYKYSTVAINRSLLVTLLHGSNHEVATNYCKEQLAARIGNWRHPPWPLT